MSNFPVSLDDDTTLPFVNDNITETGGDAINATRDAVIAVEQNIGIGAAGTTPSLATRLGVSVNPDGTLKASALTSLGLVTLPITQDQIAVNAQIPESKLKLDHRTQDLFNYIQDLSSGVNNALGWISTTGVKLDAHLIGVIYRHDLSQIDVSQNVGTLPFLNNKFRVNRDNSTAYSVVNDMNNELLAHQWADGSPLVGTQNVVTNNGSTYPSNYGHTASGIFLNTSRFAIIPQTATDVQAFADFIDNASILTLGTRIQNLYHNGISRNSRSSTLTADGYGQSLVPVTPAIAYLRGQGNNSIPIDDIAIGEDIIQFMPSTTVQNNNTFDEQFALVRPGDIVRVNYGPDGYGVEVAYVISEKKYVQGGGNKIYIVRIAGKNIVYAPNATARIDRPLYNNNKYGVLAVAGVNSPTTIPPSLIIGNPRGAQALGVNFSPDQFNETHYNLYLALYPTGNPADGYSILPAIDVTGNRGTTPGSYTLASIVDATNNALRQPGFNYRFIAFQYKGQFGIMLADSINNASFSIISAVVSGGGVYDQSSTQLNFPNNVIDVFPATGSTALDPLGLGPANANIASPPLQTSYGSPQAALFPTFLLVPLKRNNYYVNGTERELLNLDVNQVLDVYGDGYWAATIDGYVNNPGPPGHTTVTYDIPLDLSASRLKAGTTIVVQPYGTNYGAANYGRFIVQSVTFSCCAPIQTQITVYDGVHATGVSPSLIAPVGSKVAIYLSSSSATFNGESATDFTAINAVFKRHFEIYVDGNGNTFTHERGRFSVNGTISVNGTNLYNSSPFIGQMDLVAISPKLRGYQFGSVNKITLQLNSFDPVSGVYTGNLASYDGVIFTRQGPVTSGKVGEVTRFYDESNVDYIDINFAFGNTVPSLSNHYVDVQLFPSLALDEEIMLISSCQERSDTNAISNILDLRQFGNTSEEEFTTSALNYISLPERLLHFNGVIRGLDTTVTGTYTNDGLLSVKGGVALVNGNILSLNSQIFTIPPLQETYLSTLYPINYALCVNSSGDLVTMVLTDYDPILGTPNAPSRLVSVTNAVSSTTYEVDANTFSYILNNRKDLSILYIVSATVTGTGNSAATTLSIRDVRRFANDSDSSIVAVLTSDNSQGNFKTLAAALNWLKFNSAFQKTLQVKGAFSLSSDPGLNFPLDIEGEGSTAALVFNSAMNMSNVTFTDINVTFNSTLIATNVTFSNCTITFNAATTLNNVIIDPSTVNVNALISNTGSAHFLNSTINVNNIAQGFAIGSGLDFEGCIFNYNYRPTGTPPFSGADLVNAGSGMMYANLTSLVDGFTVRGCQFNNLFAEHFPFISLQLSSGISGVGFAQNIDISGNKFHNQVVGNDIRAVVAITSTIVSPITFGLYPAFPRLVNVSISGNKCDYDQMILVSTVRTAGQPITGSMLVCSNCRITDNTCGVIGYMTASDIASSGDNSEAPNLGTVRDKVDQLLIERNTCKLITNLDSVGQYIVFKATETTNVDWVQASTGACAIDRNTCNWILVGCAPWKAGVSYSTINGQGITITNNRLSVYKPTFLNSYQDTSNSTIIPPAIGILLRQDTSQQSDFNSGECIISGNILENRTYLEPIGPVFTSYQYVVGIKCESSANIFGNTINDIINNASNPMVLLGGTSTGGPIIRFTNNVLNRNGSTIAAYVQAMNSNAINNVAITNNTFDSPTVDGSNTNTGLNIPGTWAFHTNINQTAYITVSAADLQNYGASQGGTNRNTGAGALPSFNFLTDISERFSIGRLVDHQVLGFPPASYSPMTHYMKVTDYDCSVTPHERNYSFGAPLDYILPQGVKIISATLGTWLFLNGSNLDTTLPTSNQITLSLIAHNPTATSNSANGVADVKNNLLLLGGELDASVSVFLQTSYWVGGTTSGSEIQVSDLTGNTKLLTITSAQISPNQALFTNDGKHRIALAFDLNYLRLGTGTISDNITWYLSPIVVQYRW